MLGQVFDVTAGCKERKRERERERETNPFISKWSSAGHQCSEVPDEEGKASGEPVHDHERIAGTGNDRVDVPSLADLDHALLVLDALAQTHSFRSKNTGDIFF